MNAVLPAQGWRERDLGGGAAALGPGIAGGQSPLPDAEGRPSLPAPAPPGSLLPPDFTAARQRERAHAAASSPAAALGFSAPPAREPTA